MERKGFAQTLCSLQRPYLTTRQTVPLERMSVKIFGYEGANYRSQLESDQITPVISLVLYFGTEDRWTKPRHLKELLNIPSGLEDYVNDCHIHVFEIAWLPDEQIKCTSHRRNSENIWMKQHRRHKLLFMK